MKIGIVGYQGSGKSSLFEWVTGETADPSLAHLTQMAMATVPEPRVAQLCEIYQPKKVTLASLEIVDTPGLSRSHEGNAAKLAAIREAGCLVMVVGAYNDVDADADLSNFEDDLLMADLEIVSGRVERLRESVKKPRPNRDEQVKELEALEPLLEALSRGKPLREIELNPEQSRAIRSFQLFSEKPRMVVINIADDVDPTQIAAPEMAVERCFIVSLGLQRDLAQMSAEERAEFCNEMGVETVVPECLIRQMMDVSEQMLFFTAGDKEVRTWMLPIGGTAVEAAGNIHTDLAQGFIRAETMNCEDLIRLGSEREVKAQNLVRREHREYVIQDGDVITIQHN
ncbi:MAG TPA: redox-regulated ATPase YchF [Planctomycetes bacterium]|nr:redox-regulated ATPase YchF [Planctomycetota bacterium]